MSVVGLDLMPGYTAEPDGSGVRVVDAVGRPVLRIAGDAPSSAEPGGSTEQFEAWRDLCDALLLLARSHAIECTFLRERLERAEEELRVSERIAEDLYGFFRDTARRSIDPEGSRPPTDPSCG